MTVALVRNRPWRVLAIAGAAAALALAAAFGFYNTATTKAADNWEIQVGADDPNGNVETMAFYPDPLVIHVGDTINYRWAGVHTVTFNSNKPELPLFVPGPGQGELTAGPAFGPVGLTGTSINYDGTQQFSSGAPLSGPPDQMKLSVTFTRTGLFGYVCTIHPGMRGQIEVREAGSSLPETPAQAKQRGQVTAQALIGKARARQSQVPTLNTATVKTAVAGVGDMFGASSDVFVPGDVTVNRGDTVVWAFPDPANVHTVTFSSGQAPPELIQPRPQQGGGPPLFVFPANVASPAGGSTYTGTGYVNSGILPGNSTFALAIDAPPGTYTYYCIIHGSPEGGMRGTITVR